MFLSTWMFLTTNTVLSRSTLVTSNTKVINLIYHAALAHNSMKDTKFKIISTQAVRAIELLLYNFNFTDPYICYSRHVMTYKLPSQRILPPPTMPSTTTKWCRMLNLKLCASMSITLPSEIQHLSSVHSVQCAYIHIARNELLCGYANVVHT